MVESLGSFINRCERESGLLWEEIPRVESSTGIICCGSPHGKLFSEDWDVRSSHFAEYVLWLNKPEFRKISYSPKTLLEDVFQGSERFGPFYGWVTPGLEHAIRKMPSGIREEVFQAESIQDLVEIRLYDLQEALETR